MAPLATTGMSGARDKGREGLAKPGRRGSPAKPAVAAKSSRQAKAGEAKRPGPPARKPAASGRRPAKGAGGAKETPRAKGKSRAQQPRAAMGGRAAQGAALAGSGQSARRGPPPRAPGSRRKAQAAKAAPAASRRSAAKGGKSSTPTLIGRRSNGSYDVRPAEPARVVQIKALDPLVACGRHTSVKHLFRLREQVEGTRTVHLVFYDKHGWYCEHGRSCHAVTLVQRAFPHLTT